MALEKIIKITGKAVPVTGDDIDTDRIIPARFMKCVTFDGLGDYLFYDVRKNEDGSDKDHNLNKAEFKDASIIVSGNNFGCGSSREHAPQALAKAGFNAVIAEGFAEIFFGNSTQLGIPCVTVSHQDRLKLSSWIEENPSLNLEISLENEQIICGDKSISFTMREANRKALMEGNWDPLQELLDNASLVEEVEKNLAPV